MKQSARANEIHERQQATARDPHSTKPWWRGTRRVALTLLILASAAAAQTTQTVLAVDDFLHGTGRWHIEAQSPDTRVQATDGMLDVYAPAGVTLWFREPFSGSYEIRLTATPIRTSFAGHPDRVSDLNLFWHAVTPAGGDPTQRDSDGSLQAYDSLHLYYLGLGANGNHTTRLRRYDGTPARPQVAGYADATHATPDDHLGPPPSFARLHEGAPVHLRVQTLVAVGGATQLRVLADDQLVFAWNDPSPWRQGWLALRTTTSRFQISDFRVVRL